MSEKEPYVSSTNTNRATWQILNDTYWYVTSPDLPALEFSPSDDALAWQIDQTVWHISGYRNGYFWGAVAVVTFDPSDAGGKQVGRPRHLSLLGTVTGDGQVQITFIRGNSLTESVTTGVGHMVRMDGEWAFQMQMSTASGDNRLLHWANMRQTKEGDASWHQLPGVGCSVEDMLRGATYPRFAGG
jgi:hypothetical protein